MFERVTIPVKDEAAFSEVASALEQVFATGNVERFLKLVKGAGLRVRDFEAVLARGLVGKSTPGSYGLLGDSDRGQVREKYLQLVEHVAPELRARFLKVYAYY